MSSLLLLWILAVHHRPWLHSVTSVKGSVSFLNADVEDYSLVVFLPLCECKGV